MNTLIRLAQEEDCAEIARLAEQLGYPASADAMRSRLRRLLASPGDVVFVAESGKGGLSGWIHGTLSQFLESDNRAEIAGLVVDEQHHRKGIGRHLVKHVEGWALQQGVTQTVVRCRTTRPDSHQFYESLGYKQTKTQIVFKRTLS